MRNIKNFYAFALFALFLTTNMQAVQTRSQAKKQREYSQQEQTEAATKIQRAFKKWLNKINDECLICSKKYYKREKEIIRNKVIMLCCGKEMCEKCAAKLEGCPFCKQFSFRCSNTKTKKITSKPLEMTTFLVKMHDTREFPLHIFFSQEELIEIIDKSGVCCPEIMPWIQTLQKQIIKKQQELLAQKIREKIQQEEESDA